MDQRDIDNMFDCISNIFNEEFDSIKSININFYTKCSMMNKLLSENKDKYSMLSQKKYEYINISKVLEKKLNLSEIIIQKHKNDKIEASIKQLKHNIYQNELMIKLYESVLIRYLNLISSFKKRIDEYYYIERLNN